MNLVFGLFRYACSDFVGGTFSLFTLLGCTFTFICTDLALSKCFRIGDGLFCKTLTLLEAFIVDVGAELVEDLRVFGGTNAIMDELHDLVCKYFEII